MGNLITSLPSRESPPSQRSQDRELQQRGFLQLRSTHNISLADDHIPNVERFVSDLQEAVDAIRSSPSAGRYKEVHVLLLWWKDDDLGVKFEVERLRNVFQKLYRFEVHHYEIHGEKPGRDTQALVTSFLQRHDNQDNLLILYYAGHAVPSRQGSEPPIWSATRLGGGTHLSGTHQGGTHPGSSQTMSAGGIQALFEEADSDALLLYDSCHSAHPAVTVSGHGVTEVIAASGFEALAPGVGRTSFTHALIRALTESCRGPPFSAAKLHEMVLRSLKSATRDHLRDENGEIWTDENGRPALQRHPSSTPVHCFLTEERPHRGIVLTSLPLKMDLAESSHSTTSCEASTVGPSSNSSSLLTQSTFPTDSFPGSNGTTKVLLSVRIENDYFKDDMTTRLSTWREWIRNIPSEAKDMQIEAIYDSGSTLVLLSLPITLWNLLPENPAYSFVGFITSDNHVPVLDQMNTWAKDKRLMLEPFADFEVVDSETSDNAIPSPSPDHSRAPSMSSATSWMSHAFSSSRAGPQTEIISELRNELRLIKTDYRELNKEHSQCKIRELNQEGQLGSVKTHLKNQGKEIKRLNGEIWDYKATNERLEYQLNLATTGGYKELCDKLTQTLRDQDGIISGLRQEVEEGNMEITALKRHIASVHPVDSSRTKEKRDREAEILRKKILERDEYFNIGSL